MRFKMSVHFCDGRNFSEVFGKHVPNERSNTRGGQAYIWKSIINNKSKCEVKKTRHGSAFQHHPPREGYEGTQNDKGEKCCFNHGF